MLTVQNAVLILSMRYSRTLSGSMYITTTAVVLSETLKLLTCLTIIFFQKKNFAEYSQHLYDSIVLNWQDTLKMSVPAIVYALQNNLQYVAVSNLGAAVFQVSGVFSTQIRCIVGMDKSNPLLTYTCRFLRWSA